MRELNWEGSAISVQEEIYTVSEITEALRQNLESEFPSVNIIGEIANFKAHSSGHFYFTLRDERSLIRAVLFRNYVKNLPFGPDNGMLVYARGRITHFSTQGMTELITYYMEPAGRGELELKMKKLLEKLDGEGLLDPNKKRTIPKYPERIAVITSSTGSVIRDITNTLDRRWPVAELVHIHADVQGPGAVKSISEAFGKLNDLDNIDLVILARGGGSTEDLWTFNTEAVARSVVNSKYPVITGIGHETDTTVADYVADLRAATPTAAAELSAPSLQDVINKIDTKTKQLRETCLQEANTRIQLVEYLLNNSVFPSVIYKIERSGLMIDDKIERLAQSWQLQKREKIDEISRLIQVSEKLIHKKNRDRLKMLSYLAESLLSLNPKIFVKSSLENLKRLLYLIKSNTERGINYSIKELDGKLRALSTLNPGNVLKRGYAICTKWDNTEIVKNVTAVNVGENLLVHFYRGNIECEVKGKRGESKWLKNH
ncbi:exodeoxyribonuclease VII large subunit [bacterium]|nr:exodeoxyribonuclease VII large subunit [bacterium]